MWIVYLIDVAYVILILSVSVWLMASAAYIFIAFKDVLGELKNVRQIKRDSHDD